MPKNAKYSTTNVQGIARQNSATPKDTAQQALEISRLLHNPAIGDDSPALERSQKSWEYNLKLGGRVRL